MSSTLPPLLPSALPRAVPDGPPAFVAPVMKAFLVFAILSAVCLAVFALAAAEIRQWRLVQDLVNTSDLSAVPPTLRWFGRHAVALYVGMTVFCLLDAVVCWGVLRRWRWALWVFIALLVVTLPLNFIGIWVVDDVVSHLTAFLLQNLDGEEAMRLRNELRLQRIVYTGLVAATSLAFAALHAWLAYRLLKPDVQRWYR
jgi:hypothetical protein